MIAAAAGLALLAFALAATHRLRVRRRLMPARRALPLGRALVGAAAGVVVSGWPGAGVGTVVAVSAEPVLAKRRARRRADLLDDQIPDVARALASALRAGRNMPQALQAAARDAAEPAAMALRAATERLEVGAPLSEALERFGSTAGTASASLLAEALVIGRAAGANLPGVLDGLSASLAERRRIERDRKAATSQARLSALIVAGMPFAFYAMAGSGARAQVAVLLGDPLGWGLLAGGLLLEGAGWFWMRALLKVPA